MKSRKTSRFRSTPRKLRQPLRTRITTATLIPLLGLSLLSPFLLPSARALGPQPGDIGLPADATPEQVLDRLCEQLKKHPDQSIEMAQWSVAYFQSQIRETPAFASAIAIIFADCLANSMPPEPDGKAVVDGKQLSPVAGPLMGAEFTEQLAEQIANTLLSLMVGMNGVLPPGVTAAPEAVNAAIAALDPALGALVRKYLGKAIGSQVAESGFFGDSIPPAGGQQDVLRQLEELLAGETPTPTPTPTASPTLTPPPTPTPPVTPDSNM